ncbi:MAG: M20/M25/M40 family metallo-hydrolase [Chloroflexi bacterium]|nr:M20/M25/M40 family metallo-hydrolase [Chloroflexota bacterium]
MDLTAHLRELVAAHGPSGHEGPVREVIRAAWAPLVDEFQQDGLGSLIGIRHANSASPTKRRIMLAAHMDEIAMMVRDIHDGFLFVRAVAGFDHRLAPALPVTVYGKRELPGIIATTPPHLLTPELRREYPAWDTLMVDLGLPAAEVDALVQIGDLVTPDAPLLELRNGRLAGKAFDDRACVAIVTHCLHELQHMQHHWEVLATATAQEESGLLGARTAAQRMQPDAAIALDVGFAAQPGIHEEEAVILGGGPVLALGANIHPALFQGLKETAQKYEIAHQVEPAPAATGTDAWAIQTACDGIPTALISLPLLNMHAPVETLDLRDVERSGRLLAHFICSLSVDFLREHSGYAMPTKNDLSTQESAS